MGGGEERRGEERRGDERRRPPPRATCQRSTAGRAWRRSRQQSPARRAGARLSLVRSDADRARCTSLSTIPHRCSAAPRSRRQWRDRARAQAARRAGRAWPEACRGWLGAPWRAHGCSHLQRARAQLPGRESWRRAGCLLRKRYGKLRNTGPSWERQRRASGPAAASPCASGHRRHLL